MLNPKAPSYEKFQRPAPGFEDAFDWVRNDCPAAGRFLTDKNLHPGDRFIPVVEAGNENYTGAIAAIYQFNSELKGNIIAGTLPPRAGGIAPAAGTVPDPRVSLLLRRGSGTGILV